MISPTSGQSHFSSLSAASYLPNFSPINTPTSSEGIDADGTPPQSPTSQEALNVFFASKLHHMSIQMENYKLALTGKISVLEAQIASNQLEINQLKGQTADLSSINENLHKRVQELEIKKAKLESEKEQLEARLKMHQEAIVTPLATEPSELTNADGDFHKYADMQRRNLRKTPVLGQIVFGMEMVIYPVINNIVDTVSGTWTLVSKLWNDSSS